MNMVLYTSDFFIFSKKKMPEIKRLCGFFTELETDVRQMIELLNKTINTHNYQVVIRDYNLQHRWTWCRKSTCRHNSQK